jgi:hypothetical protein
MWWIGNTFATENLSMHSHDQHFLVIGPVEYADPSSLWQIARGTPEKIVLQFGGAWMFEAKHLTALRIDTRHDMPDGPVLSRGVHPLQNQQYSMAVTRVV